MSAAVDMARAVVGLAPALTRDTAFVIYSEKRQAYWRAEEAGYTRALANAGIYTKADAERIALASARSGALRSVAYRLDDLMSDDHGVEPMRAGTVLAFITEEATR